MEYKYEGTEFKFYQTYIDLLDEDRNKRETEKKRDITHDSEITPEESFESLEKKLEEKLKNHVFRKYVLDKLGKNVRTTKMIAPVIMPHMLRPQRLFIDKDDFYVACDMMTNTYYICYKYLMMIDVDFYKLTDIDDEKNNIISQFEHDINNCWKLYSTRNGIHAFLVSKKIDYHSDESVELMLSFTRNIHTELKNDANNDEKESEKLCDFYYVLYSYLRGYCVRLNRKKDEEKLEYKFI
ncbi:unnamed protein product, partial [marine sediment metagenome]